MSQSEPYIAMLLGTVSAAPVQGKHEDGMPVGHCSLKQVQGHMAVTAQGKSARSYSIRDTFVGSLVVSPTRTTKPLFLTDYIAHTIDTPHPRG